MSTALDFMDEDGDPIIRPRDGYRAELYESFDKLLLILTMRVRGSVTESVHVRSWPTPVSARDKGDAARLLLLLEAVARFLTTGGGTREIGEMLAAIESEGVGALSFGEPWYLLDSAICGEAVAIEHTFANDRSSEVLRWTEDQFVEVIPMVEFLNDLERNG